MYKGEEQIDRNGPYERWMFQGAQENDYYHKNGVPRRISEIPNDYIDFQNFKEGPIDDKHFEVPEYCTSTCGALTWCEINRLTNIK